jgi:hypothetical protein
VVRLQGGHRIVEWRREYWQAIGEFLKPLAAAPAVQRPAVPRPEGQRPLESAERAGTVQK